MKTTKLIMSLVLLFLAHANLMAMSTTAAKKDKQVHPEDTVINCIAYFSKGDTLTYQAVNANFKCAQKDTTWEERFIEDYQLVVLDSTKDGYRMELTYLDTQWPEDNELSTKEKLHKLLASQSKGLKVIFRTDEWGEVTKVENWREIKDKMIQSSDAAFDQFFPSLGLTPAQQDSLKQYFSIDKLKSLTHLSYANEDAVKESIEEFTLLFDNFGQQIKRGDYEENQDENQMKRNVTIKADYSPIEDEEMDTEDDYFVASKVEVTLPASEVMGFGADVMNLAMSNDSFKGEINKAVKEMKGDAHINTMKISKYWYNGWPKQVITINESMLDETNKKMKTKEVRCTSWVFQN